MGRQGHRWSAASTKHAALSRPACVVHRQGLRGRKRRGGDRISFHGSLDSRVHARAQRPLTRARLADPPPPRQPRVGAWDASAPCETKPGTRMYHPSPLTHPTALLIEKRVSTDRQPLTGNTMSTQWADTAHAPGSHDLRRRVWPFEWRACTFNRSLQRRYV